MPLRKLNRLIALTALKNFDINKNKLEFDMIVSTGEQISIALISMALKEIGLKGKPLLGWQVPITGSNDFTKAKINKIDDSLILGLMKKGEIPIIAGFQGIDEENNIVTFGRGGSDTSAVAIAAAIKADRCDIYTDVDGVYTSDPRIVKKARKLDKISYEEMLEFASLGAKVLQTRSVEMAMRHEVVVQVLSSQTGEIGTFLTKEDKKMENELVSGIAYSKDEANITLINIHILCLVLQYMHVIMFSIRCVCPTGFRKIGSSGSDECEDIDECFHNPDICGEGGECRNTQGS